MQLTIYTCILLISWIGSQLIVGGQMQTGQLSSIITYAWQILSSLMMLSMVFVMVIMAQSSAERIIEVIEEEPALKNKENPVKEVSNGSIKFENVSFAYSDEKEEDKFALENINVDIYTNIYLTVSGAKELNTTSNDYEELINTVTDNLEGISEERREARYNQLYDAANSKIEDAQKEFDEEKEKGQKEIDKAEKEQNQ